MAVMQDGGRVFASNSVPVEPLEVQPLGPTRGQVDGLLVDGRVLRFPINEITA